MSECARPVAGALVEVRSATKTVLSFETGEDGKFDLSTSELTSDEKTTLVFRGSVQGIKVGGILELGKENIIVAKLPKRLCKKPEK
jgi:hypothetical protein